MTGTSVAGTSAAGTSATGTSAAGTSAAGTSVGVVVSLLLLLLSQPMDATSNEQAARARNQ
jgi:hypothetical protein